MIKTPHTPYNVISYISIKHNFVLFGDDIIVPIKTTYPITKDEDDDTIICDGIVIGPCIHLGGNEFNFPMIEYVHPSIN